MNEAFQLAASAFSRRRAMVPDMTLLRRINSAPSSGGVPTTRRCEVFAGSLERVDEQDQPLPRRLATQRTDEPRRRPCGFQFNGAGSITADHGRSPRAQPVPEA